jgi:hypothetical protein
VPARSFHPNLIEDPIIMQILSARELLLRVPPELRKRAQWALSTARCLHSQARQHMRDGNIQLARMLASNADDFQLIYENILLRHTSVPVLDIPPIPTGTTFVPFRGRIS